jgi:enamine deaminase RidA (YjgF/YER057c/UK114 family)
MLMRSLLRNAALAGVVLSIGSVAVAAERRYVLPRTAADKGLPPFSGGVFVGDTFYLSGQIGHKDGKVPPDAAAEARLVLDIVQDHLKQAGLTMDDLVSVQVFCSDVSHYAAFNDVYRTYFKKEFPARAFLGSGRLLFDARFEVQGIAAKR